MYLRPGNLLRDFVVEKQAIDISKIARLERYFLPTGKVLTSVLYEASQDERFILKKGLILVMPAQGAEYLNVEIRQIVGEINHEALSRATRAVNILQNKVFQVLGKNGNARQYGNGNKKTSARVEVFFN